MPYAKLNVTLPEGVWIGEISSEFPAVRFRVLAALPGDDSGVGLVEITGPDLESVLGAVERRDGISSIDLLRVVDDEALVQFETTDPVLLLAVQNSMVPLELPFVVANGVAELELTASRERLSELGEQLTALGMSYEVEYIRGTIDTEALLTDAQRDLLDTAVGAGYYDTPRGCTLTELADRVGVAKSTASERLHRAEEKVIKKFVREADSAELVR
jgi:hypothetical protein